MHQIFLPAQRIRPGHGARADVQAIVWIEPLERERIARWSGGIRPYDEPHVMAPFGQRVACLHRLDAVGAVERKSDVSEDIDAHLSS